MASVASQGSAPGPGVEVKVKYKDADASCYIAVTSMLETDIANIILETSGIGDKIKIFTTDF